MNLQFHISVASAPTIADSVHAPYWGGFFLFKALLPHGFLLFLIFFCIYFAFLAFLHCNSFFALFCWHNCQTPSLQVSVECIVGEDLNRPAKSLVHSVLLNRIFIWSHLVDLWSGRKPLPWGHRPTQPCPHQLCPREQKCAAQKWPT